MLSLTRSQISAGYRELGKLELINTVVPRSGSCHGNQLSLMIQTHMPLRTEELFKPRVLQMQVSSPSALSEMRIEQPKDDVGTRS